MAEIIDDAGLPWSGPTHYGNPFAEERALRESRGVALFTQWGCVRVSGPDRARWLHSLSTCDFEGEAQRAGAGEDVSSETLILDPSGRIQSAAAVAYTREAVLLFAPIAEAREIAQFLESMKFMLRVEIDVVEVDGVAGVVEAGTSAGAGSEGEGDRGDLAAHVSALAADALVALWRDPWPEVGENSAHYGLTAEDHPAADHRRWIAFVRAGSGAAVLDAADDEGLARVGTAAWEALRVTDRRPLFMRECATPTLAHELDWLRTAVHLHKGCYRGQETIAKIVNLGRPPRRLTYLYLDGLGEDLPAPGAEVYAGTRKVGVVTSVARTLEDGPVALALVKRSTALDAELEIRGAVYAPFAKAAGAEDAAAESAAAEAAAESAAPESAAETAAPTFTCNATQEAIVAVNGMSSVTPEVRPGQEFRGGAGAPVPSDHAGTRGRGLM